MNAINLHSGPTPPGKDRNRDYKLKMNKAKNYFEMGEIFGIQKEEVEGLERNGEGGLRELVKGWVGRMKGNESAEKGENGKEEIAGKEEKEEQGE